MNSLSSIELLFAYLCFAKCQINVSDTQTEKFDVNFKMISVFFFSFRFILLETIFLNPYRRKNNSETRKFRYNGID